MSRTLIASALLFAAVPVSAQDRPPMTTSLSKCAVAEALRLEPSGEPADVVAEAGVGSPACDRELGYRDNTFGTHGYDAQRIVAKDRALHAVVEKRMAAKAPPS